MNSEKYNKILRRWGKSLKPVRRLILWGQDDNNEPSFAILFGYHEPEEYRFKIESSDIEEYNKYLTSNSSSEQVPEISPGEYTILEKSVDYIGYILLKGSSGHLPRIPKLTLRKDVSYNYYRRSRTESEPYLIAVKGAYHGGSIYDPWRLSDFKLFPSTQIVSIPYFSDMKYEECAKIVRKKSFTQLNFKIVDNPNDVLKLNEGSLKYLDLLIELMSNCNLYSRKRALIELINTNPPKAIYEKILELGSSEVISGLFMELARKKDPIIKEEAKNLIYRNIRWDDSRAIGGLKRWANIYLNAVDDKRRKQRTSLIREKIAQLELIPVYAGTGASNGRRRRSRYRSLSSKKPSGMSYTDWVDTWGSYTWEGLGYSLKFKENPFTNNTSLKHKEFKNTLQEAEIYGLPDVIGKIAYFVDTPKFKTLLKNSGHYGTGLYFERYVRRIIDSYARTDEEKFLVAMKHFVLNYRRRDLITSYEGKTNYNTLLKHYFRPPRATGRSHGYRYWEQNGPRINSIDFKHARLKEDYEHRDEIWKHNLEQVLELIKVASVMEIQNYFYSILMKYPNIDEALRQLPTKYLVELSLISNTRISSFFREKLSKRIEESAEFNSEIMFALMECNDSAMHDLAWEYYDKVGGMITPKDLVDIILLDNFEVWFDLFNGRLNEFKGEAYFEFVSSLILKLEEIIAKKSELFELAFDTIMASAIKINDFKKEMKVEIIEVVLSLILREPDCPEWLSLFLRNLIFSIPLGELKEIIAELDIDLEAKIELKEAQGLISYLRAISANQIPSDENIINILELGTPRMVNTLVNLIEENKDDLKSRSTILMLLFESEMIALNEIATDVFKTLPKESLSATLLTFINSPIKKVYSFGLEQLDKIYQEKIPKEFILKMLEHSSHDVRSYVSDKLYLIIKDIGNGNGKSNLFMYYVKTLILLPNLHSKSKDDIYKAIPEFAKRFKDKIPEIEKLLLKIGGSNVIKDSERALLALAKIRKEVELNAS